MMSFLPSPKPPAVQSGRTKHGQRAKDRRHMRFPLLVMQLEQRQVLPTPTLLSISASASNLAAGAIEVFTATAVTNPPNGSNLPTGGTVTFSNGATTLGSAPLVNGLASFSTTLGPGTYSVTASYSGTATFASSSTTSSAGFIFDQAGTGTYGSTDLSSGTVQATAAELSSPFGVAVGPTGTIYLADTFNDVIDAVNPSTGVITVIAGTLGVNGPASSGLLYDPRGIAAERKFAFHRRS